jgi:hypothetical protein
MTDSNTFTYKNIAKLPNPPYVRKYSYPLQHTKWIFWHKDLDDCPDKKTALAIAKNWLHETNHTGYLNWGGELIPINRNGLIVDYDYKRWSGTPSLIELSLKMPQNPDYI